MAKDLVRSFNRHISEKIGVRSIAASLCSEIIHGSRKHEKKYGGFFVVTSSSWLAEKIECCESAINKNLKKLRELGVISTKRVRALTTRSGGHICDLKIECLIDFSPRDEAEEGQSPFLEGQSPFLEGQSPFLEGQSPFLEGRDPLETVSSKGLKNEKSPISKDQYELVKEIYKEKIAIETGAEKKPEIPPTEKTKTLDEQFDEWWEIYPKRSGGSPKADAKRAFIAVLSKKKSTPGQKGRDTPTFAELLAKTKLFADRTKTEIAAEKNPQQLAFLRGSIPMAATWLNKDRWLDETEPEAQQQVTKPTAELDPKLKGFLASNRAMQSNHAWVFENTRAEISLDSVKLFCENAYQRSLLANYQDQLSSYFSKPVMIFASEAEAQEAMAKPKLSAPVHTEVAKPEWGNSRERAKMGDSFKNLSGIVGGILQQLPSPENPAPEKKIAMWTSEGKIPPPSFQAANILPDAPRVDRREKLRMSFEEKLNNAMVASNLEITTAYPEEKRYG